MSFLPQNGTQKSLSRQLGPTHQSKFHYDVLRMSLNNLRCNVLTLGEEIIYGQKLSR